MSEDFLGGRGKWEAGLFGGRLLAFCLIESERRTMSASYPIGDPVPFSGPQSCVYPSPSYQYWVPPQVTQTTVTEVCEYDEEGRMVKKTTTTTTTTRDGYYASNSNELHLYGSG